ncbi:MAG: aminotransferase class IV [Polyangiaceae bacterium]|nr:aminotransferase class IV [Polyangiaceae bacterium]
MKRAVCLNGVLTPEADAKVSVFDRGFVFGDGVFETMRTYGGRVFAFREHVERLDASARAVGFSIGVSFADIERDVVYALREVHNAESVVRVFVTRGEGPLTLVPTNDVHPTRVVIVDELRPMPAAMYREGVSVVTDATQPAIPTAKCMSYLPHQLAVMRAHAMGAHEALLTDNAGRILEGATSNFFLVKGGELFTAPAERVLPGITRAHVLSIATRLGIAVHFSPVLRDDISGGPEAFLTSTMREIAPVVRVDGAVVGNGAPGPITRLLHAEFRKGVGLDSNAPPWL